MAVTQAPYPRQSSFPTRMEIFRAEPESHVLEQHAFAATDGAQYQVFTARPRQPAPGRAGYPVLYLLDGNAGFDLLTSEALAGVPDLGLVGIGYETPFRFDAVRRSLDFTPPRDGQGLIDDPAHPGRRIGGADNFLDRFHNEIIPFAESRLPADASRRSLWGHSLGGLLALYSLLSRPGPFRRYIAASPSIWWGDEYLLRFEETHRQPGPGFADVAIMLGESERRSSPGAPEWNGPAPATLELVRLLEQRPDLGVSLQIFPRAGHAASLFESLPLALTLAHNFATPI